MSVCASSLRPFEVDTALSLAHAERVIALPTTTLTGRRGACTPKVEQYAAAASLAHTEAGASAGGPNASGATATLPTLRPDTPLWFVPGYHAISVVGMSVAADDGDARHGTREMFCTVRVEDGLAEEDGAAGAEEDVEGATRLIVVSVAQMRRHYPQLLIDYLLRQATYDR